MHRHTARQAGWVNTTSIRLFLAVWTLVAYIECRFLWNTFPHAHWDYLRTATRNERAQQQTGMISNYYWYRYICIYFSKCLNDISAIELRQNWNGWIVCFTFCYTTFLFVGIFPSYYTAVSYEQLPRSRIEGTRARISMAVIENLHLSAWQCPANCKTLLRTRKTFSLRVLST